jgi:N-acetylmuramoyl-L-alanine amidase
MAITLLRETRMPCIQVEPCFITNAREEDLLAESGFVRDLAVAMAIGMERFVAATRDD